MNSGLTDISGNLLTEQYGREVFNACKVLAISPQSDLNDFVNPDDFVALQDEWLQPEPDMTKGFSPSTGEPKVFRALGKLLPYQFYMHKLEEKIQTELLFLLPDSCIAGKLFNINEESFQATNYKKH